MAETKGLKSITLTTTKLSDELKELIKIVTELEQNLDHKLKELDSKMKDLDSKLKYVDETLKNVIEV